LAAKTRPAIYVSGHHADPPRLIVPFTIPESRMHHEIVFPKLQFLDRAPVTNIQGLASVPTVRLERRIGILPSTAMTELRKALRFALDLD
jgi:mRNA interferase MazF